MIVETWRQKHSFQLQFWACVAINQKLKLFNPFSLTHWNGGRWTGYCFQGSTVSKSFVLDMINRQQTTILQWNFNVTKGWKSTCLFIINIVLLLGWIISFGCGGLRLTRGSLNQDSTVPDIVLHLWMTDENLTMSIFGGVLVFKRDHVSYSIPRLIHRPMHR